MPMRLPMRLERLEAERRNNEYAMNPTDFAASMILREAKLFSRRGLQPFLRD